MMMCQLTEFNSKDDLMNLFNFENILDLCPKYDNFSKCLTDTLESSCDDRTSKEIISGFMAEIKNEVNCPIV